MLMMIIVERDIQLSGRARLTLKPTTGKCLPFIGGMQLCFLDQPDFNFDLEGLADICDWSFLRRKVSMKISEISLWAPENTL